MWINRLWMTLPKNEETSLTWRKIWRLSEELHPPLSDSAATRSIWAISDASTWVPSSRCRPSSCSQLSHLVGGGSQTLPCFSSCWWPRGCWCFFYCPSSDGWAVSGCLYGTERFSLTSIPGPSLCRQRTILGLLHRVYGLFTTLTCTVNASLCIHRQASPEYVGLSYVCC